MISRLVIFVLAAVASPVWSQASVESGATRLPETYFAALRSAGVPTSASYVVVEPLDRGVLRASANPAVAANPASTMKLVTTYTALRVLGPAYTWKTEAYALGRREGGVILGDLGVRGSGDPKLVVEQLWLLVERLRGLGLREIRGDLVLDKSAFGPLPHDPGEFDGDALRAYNVGPDALLVNYKALSLTFVPDLEAGVARVVVLPPLAGFKVPATVKGLEGGCGDWKTRLRSDFARPMAPVFRGGYPLACGERTWNLSVLDHTEYFAAAFAALWRAGGGVWEGKVREGVIPVGSRLLAVHESPPLSDVVRDINKYSNNVMAQQLFLTLGADTGTGPASFAQSQSAVRAWLASNGLAQSGLVIENGVGLSRIERISAQNLAALLEHAYRSSVMPELMASLPVTGVDGTTRRRTGAAGAAHVKTGLLSDVRAIAGYVLAASGERYVIVAILNHPKAGAAQSAHDALLEWVRQRG